MIGRELDEKLRLPRYEEVSLSLIIAGCLLLGLGIGMFFDEAGAGMITGIGLGLIGEFFFGSKWLAWLNRSK